MTLLFANPNIGLDIRRKKIIVLDIFAKIIVWNSTQKNQKINVLDIFAKIIVLNLTQKNQKKLMF